VLTTLETLLAIEPSHVLRLVLPFAPPLFSSCFSLLYFNLYQQHLSFECIRVPPPHDGTKYTTNGKASLAVCALMSVLCKFLQKTKKGGEKNTKSHTQSPTRLQSWCAQHIMSSIALETELPAEDSVCRVCSWVYSQQGSPYVVSTLRRRVFQ